MPLSDGYKSIGPAWASSTTKGSDPADDRIDPDDAALTPPIVVANGWPASFSSTNAPRRPVFNELEFRKDSALLDIRNFGILPWDTAVDTLMGGVKQVSGTVYKALVDNGPTYSNATDPTTAGQTVWETVSGTTAAPAQPGAPTAVAANGTLDWSWNCPKDNGAAVTLFDFQWREQGTTTWNTVSNLTSARYLLTGITNGTVYQAQVSATNNVGDSGYGAQGMGTPVAAIPGGGTTLALRANTGDASGRVDLDWLVPANNGAAITGYTYQWKSGSQTYSTGRQGTTTSTSATVSGLTDGTSYDFQVRATNSAGDGPWSNESSATPATPVVPPVDTVPGAPTILTGTPRRPLIVDWTWEVPDSNGGQRISSYDHQWRYSGDAWVGANLENTEGSFRRITVADATRNVQARVRAINSVGTGGWSSPTVTVQSSALLVSPTQRHRFTSSQTWNWPYDDLDRAVAVVRGRTDGPIVAGFDSSRDITLSNVAWVGGVSDGTTLWFITGTSPDTAFAYNASTRAMDSSRDITLGNAAWVGGVSDGTTLWFITTTSPDTAFAYNASTRARDSSRDITLGDSFWVGGVSDGTTLWFITTTSPDTAFAYNASTRARDSSRDITLGDSLWRGGVSDGTTLWFITTTSPDTAFAYNASTRAMDSSRDITLGNAAWVGGVSDGITLWFISTINPDTAFAYNASTMDIATELAVGGSTYTTEGDDDGYVIQSLSGIANNAAFVIAIGVDGMVDVYPQC